MLIVLGDVMSTQSGQCLFHFVHSPGLLCSVACTFIVAGERCLKARIRFLSLGL